ncbi:MAG: PilX N-terminal domain-containing pilus assembly protein [Hyphomicrobiales bacterium]
MHTIREIVRKDDGSVIVWALLVLVLLTILGISAVSTSNSELNIAANAQLHQIAFFTAESGWHVMVDWLDDQYPLPTANLGSGDFGTSDGIDNNGNGVVDEADEIGPAFTAANYASPGAVPLSTSHRYRTYSVKSQFSGAGYQAGWDPTKFLRYDYQVTSTGTVPARDGNALSRITIRAGKMQEK